jgi:peroxiredoxin
VERSSLAGRVALIGAAVAVAAAAIGVLMSSGSEPAARGEAAKAAAPVAGAAMPDFRLPSADGRELGPRDLRGRVVLYEFWATWCAPCHVQVEILKKMWPEATARGIEFVAIAAGEPAAVVRAHLERDPYPYPVLFDPDDRVGGALDVLGLPTLVVADREGRIVWRHTGLVDESTIEQAFAAAGAPAG